MRRAQDELSAADDPLLILGYVILNRVDLEDGVLLKEIGECLPRPAHVVGEPR